MDSLPSVSKGLWLLAEPPAALALDSRLKSHCDITVTDP